MALADELLAVLNDPTHMWSHALQELPRGTQRLFLTLALMPTPAPIDNLQLAYISQGFERTDTFLDSLRSLEDSFVVISTPSSRGSAVAERVVSFRNPSLEEFGYVYLNEYSDWLSVLVDGLVLYDQFVKVFDLATSRNDVEHRSREYRYPEIYAWVRSNCAGLLSSAINLLATKPNSSTYPSQRIRVENLGTVLDFIRTFK